MSRRGAFCALGAPGERRIALSCSVGNADGLVALPPRSRAVGGGILAASGNGTLASTEVRLACWALSGLVAVNTAASAVPASAPRWTLRIEYTLPLTRHNPE